MSVGYSLNIVRQDAAITVRWLSRRSSVYPQTIRLIESGGGTIKSLDKILEALQYEIWWERKYDDMEVGPALARFRKEAKITQKEFAKAIRVSGQTIVDFERRNTGRIPTIEKYARYFNVNIHLRPVLDRSDKLIGERYIPQSD